MDYGARIKAARKAAGLTQKQLADRLGISYVNISQLENNQRTPTMSTLQRVADALGIHIFDIMGIGDKMKNLRVEYDEIVSLPGFEAEFTPEKKAKLELLLSEGASAMYDVVSDDTKKEFWKMLIDGGGVPKFNLNSNRERLNSILEQMNDEGYTKVADYAEDILPRYRRQDAPQPPPDSQEGTDTA